MAFLRCIGFKIKRKRTSDHVCNGDDESDKFSGDLDLMGGFETVKRFDWDEIERATKNFSRVIGSGGFSTVYLAQFQNSSLAAMKIHSSSERLSRVYKQELQIVKQLHHDHIVKFLGYCDDHDEGVLVFEYVPNGNLQEKLHGDSGGGDGSGLSWKNRMNIAFQLTKAIHYLHEKCELQIVHGDLKSSNILLDQDLNCKLCDFGSSKMGFSSTVLPPSSSPHSMSRHQLMMGSPGYVDPHYMRTGVASKKNDIYSLGIIILELITGREAFCPEKGQMLSSFASSVMFRDHELVDAVTMAEVVDPRLKLEFNMEEATVMASMAALCLRQSPSLRPSAANVLLLMKEKIDSLSFESSTTTDRKL